MLCKKCGEIIDDDSAFCNHCGCKQNSDFNIDSNDITKKATVIYKEIVEPKATDISEKIVNEAIEPELEKAQKTIIKYIRKIVSKRVDDTLESVGIKKSPFKILFKKK